MLILVIYVNTAMADNSYENYYYEIYSAMQSYYNKYKHT